MRIRQATDEDAAAIAALLHAVTELHSLADETPEFLTQKVADNLQRAATTGSSTVYVAETDDQAIVGYCAVHWIAFVFLTGGEAYVSELFIHPDQRGRGAGSKLLETVVAAARERGCARLSLNNRRDSDAYARAFYAKQGWTEREIMANFVYLLE
jgi:ribosomal protein S18 acetylase RimI-like enzyme